MKNSLAALSLVAALLASTAQPAYFVPSHVLPGIGVSRQDLTDETLARRTEAMIQSQTFGIMRDPEAVSGAQRILSSKLQRLFRDAERKSGFPASVLQAIAYLESWGLPNAESHTGPRGIMQISGATGRRMGLRVIYATRRRVIKTRVATVNKRGKTVYRTLKRKESYTVLVRDERLNPEKAIPAAARYLAGLEQRYGGRDWAIWAYHCGEGCVGDFVSMAKTTPGLTDPPYNVARVFFGCSPVWNRELCGAIHAQMDRDYSPTYWFRVMRAEQLLSMYQGDQREFRDLANEYRNPAASLRAPDRLSVWLKPQDLIYETTDRIRSEDGARLATAPDDPGFFGFRVIAPGATPGAPSADWRLKALPSTIGTLEYIAFETRRLFEAMRPGQEYVPLTVTTLILSKEESASGAALQSNRVAEHSSGQVFDLSLSGLPDDERQCLQFVLDDLGWYGYLGFIEEPTSGQAMHIGCSPTSRDFFARVFEDAQAALRDRNTPPAPLPSDTPVETAAPPQ